MDSEFCPTHEFANTKKPNNLLIRQFMDKTPLDNSNRSTQSKIQNTLSFLKKLAISTCRSALALASSEHLVFPLDLSPFCSFLSIIDKSNDVNM